MLYVITYMWNLKNKGMNITKQKQIHRYREQTSGYQKGEGRGKIGVEDEEVQAAIHKIDKDILYSTGNIANIL